MIISPEEVKRLRLKAGLTQKKMAKLAGIGLSSWQKKETAETLKSYSPISGAEYNLLLLFADEHPDYILCKRETLRP